MIHLTFGENWLHREGAGFALPPVQKGPMIREIVVRGNPPFAHEWYVARDLKGLCLYEGTSADDAREAAMGDAGVRGTVAARPRLIEQLVRRYGMLAPGRFSVKLRADGVPIVSDEGDSSGDCLLFWSGAQRVVSSSEVATSAVRLGRRLMGGTFFIPRNRFETAGGAALSSTTVAVNLAVMVLQPGQGLMLENDKGREVLEWDGGELRHGRVEERQGVLSYLNA